MIRVIDRLRATKLGACLRSYFMGAWYPVTVAALVLLGHLLSIEFFLAIPIVFLVTAALILCESARPCIIFVLSFVYQVSLKHAPGVPTFSDYYFTSWRLAVVVLLGAVLVLGVICFIVKNRIFEGIGIRKTPLLIPLLVLSAAFVLNGAFSGDWSFGDLVYGVAQAAVYTLVFLFFLYGLKGERAGELCAYFTYVSAVVAVILTVEVAALYLSGSVIVDGSAVKDNILFGWGIWNTAGVALATLIPMCFLGAMRSRCSVIYFAIAVLDMLAVVLTLSRNSILFGAIAFAVCAVMLCFVGRYKRVYRFVVIAGVLLVAGTGALLWDKISVLVSDLIERGFSDNGRYDLWKTGIDNFVGAPVFGIGFFGFVSDTFIAADFLPNMAHQTFVQILSAMGVFGMCAYLYYRVSTLMPFVKRPTAEKLMLLGSVLVMLGESLLDNFIFYFLPTFHYTIAIVIAIMLYREQTTGACEINTDISSEAPRG